MKQNKVLLCFLDKEDIPDHLFVEGLLAKRNSSFNRVFLITSQARGSQKFAKRFHRSIVLNVLLRRAGFSRFYNIFITFFILASFEQRYPQSAFVVFVRNDPSTLLGCAMRKRISKNKLIFQSSFPHEKVPPKVKGVMARFLFRLSGSIDGITAVSRAGLERTANYFKTRNSLVIPLLADEFKSPTVRKNPKILNFIYVGTFAAERRLDIVLRGFAEAAKVCPNRLKLTLYGGDNEEWRSIVQLSGLELSELPMEVSFGGRLNRNDVFDAINQSDIGLSLVPATEINYEMSPTKLAEYMSAGVAVLASDGVEFQKEIVQQSQAGHLVEFKVNSISNGIQFFLDREDQLQEMKEISYRFAVKHLNYDNIQNDFVKFLNA